MALSQQLSEFQDLSNELNSIYFRNRVEKFRCSLPFHTRNLRSLISNWYISWSEFLNHFRDSGRELLVSLFCKLTWIYRKGERNHQVVLCQNTKRQRRDESVKHIADSWGRNEAIKGNSNLSNFKNYMHKNPCKKTTFSQKIFFRKMMWPCANIRVRALKENHNRATTLVASGLR